jgi:tetratricopeptide (TPR) repeat protein
MTSNHLLLYRLTELMLEHEQHFISVDLLFDDAQIGTFVKSIQIDSPYQQMILEGVLTESVKEEKVYVSFTAEGYYHYILGEVIHNITKNKGPEELKKLAEKNTLNGIKEGVEQCLIREVQQNNLSRLIRLIDISEITLSICTLPLAYAFEIRHLQPDNHLSINNLTQLLLKQSSEGDIKTIRKVLSHLIKLQKKPLYAKVLTSFTQNCKFINYEILDLKIQLLDFLDEKNKVKETDKIRREIKFINDKHQTSKLLLELGIKLKYMSKYPEALECLHEANNYFKKYASLDRVILAKSNDYMGLIHSDIGQPEIAIRYIRKALKIRKREFGENHISTAISYNHLGSITQHYYAHKNRTAIEYFKKALDIKERYLGKSHMETAEVLNNLAMSYSKTNNFKQSEIHYLKALNIFIKNASETDIWVSVIYNNIASLYSNNNILEKAFYYQKKAMDINVLTNGPNHYISAVLESTLANILSKMKRHGEAAIHFLNVLDTMRKILPKYHIGLQTAYNNAAASLMDCEKYKDAIKYNLKLLSILEMKGEENPDKQKVVLLRIAHCYRKLNNNKKTEYYISQANSMQI